MCTNLDIIHGKRYRKDQTKEMGQRGTKDSNNNRFNSSQYRTDLYRNQSRQMLVHCGILQNHNNMKSPTENLWVAVSRQSYQTRQMKIWHFHRGLSQE